jgi:hypothetical protein
MTSVIYVRTSDRLKEAAEKCSKERETTVSALCREFIARGLAELSYLTPEAKKALGVEP